jgi:superfamily II DNA or RNA helicase
MFEAIPNAAKSKLWKHQRAALDFAIDHLNKRESPCLIRMPTGTGKTGIIACLTRLSNQKSSLVLTPWAHLRTQMVTDLEKEFWKKVDLTPKKLEVVSMFPSTAKNILKSTEPQVIVATFATLNDLRLNDTNTYRALAAAVSLVVVDEGHYEPAVEWGKSVKNLNTKTVLLTATPYRNDLKLFRITDSNRSTHHFTHKQAVKDEIIRQLRFEEIVSPTDIPSLSAQFAKLWKAAKRMKILPSQFPRAIICCSGATDIEETVSHLRKAGLKAIGVHEQFENAADPNLLKAVPDPKRSTSEIWVHQHKLTEGLDDHRFCCVALFTRIRNDRKLIQQIGRVLRRDSDDRDTPAVLVAPHGFSAEAEWNAYLEFETDLTLLEPQHFRDVVNTLLGAQPKVEYFEGRFRRRFRPDDLSERPTVIIPPSVLVRRMGKDFTLDDYIEDCTDTLNTEDAVILGPEINAPCQKSPTFALWVYASVRNSRFLQDTSLYEIKLETHCVVITNSLVFMTDSKGNFPREYLEEHTAAVPAEQLTRFIDKSFRPTHASVDSAIPYDTVLRGGDLRGHNLLNVPVSLTDRVQICRSARGISGKSGRRYVGMNNGRLRKEVSGEGRRIFELKTFVSWAESVANILNSKIAGSALFDRYMQTCAPPANPTPKTICLDLVRMDLELTLADGRECSLKSSACDIKESVRDNRAIYTCSFDLDGEDMDGMSVSLRVDYHPVKRRFWFNKDGGAAVRVNLEDDDESSTKSLAEFLNQKQDIVLIGLDGGEIVYQGRNFYKIDYSYAEQVLIDLIEQPPNTPQCKTEKGSKQQIAAVRRAKGTRFPAGSLFRAVAEQLFELPFDADLLICDDLGTECADFVGANFENHQLALIHAKAGSGDKISASAFHDVVAQSMKNLVYLTRNAEVPKGIGSWWRNGKWNNTSIPRLYRAPNGVPVREHLWNKLKSDIIGSSNPELFVILVTTGCCDPQELKDAVNDTRKRIPEMAQLLHLLDGLNGYARQLGVRLVIYDLPYQQD